MNTNLNKYESWTIKILIIHNIEKINLSITKIIKPKVNHGYL